MSLLSGMKSKIKQIDAVRFNQSVKLVKFADNGTKTCHISIYGWSGER